MRKIVGIILIAFCFNSNAQEEVGIVTIIDDLTVRWDQAAIKLKTYQGVQNFCETKEYREKTMNLLDNIHHWDTSLYFIVKEKYAENQDAEAVATLKDIESLEVDYTTESFKVFIQEECGMVKTMEKNFQNETRKEYEKDVKRFEKELIKYVNSITTRIDIIDEHIHHLKLD